MRTSVRNLLIALPAVLAIAAGMLVVPPPVAVAGPAFSCMSGTSVPDCVFRIDSRAPVSDEGIFDTGFQVPGEGTNENLLDHVSGKSAAGAGRPGGIRNTTNFVSTSEDSAFAAGWIRTSTNPRFASEGGWVYSITPTEEFVSMNRSLAEAAKAENGELAAVAARALSTFGDQREWAARGGVPREQIVSARQMGADGAWIGEPVLNPGYAPASSRPTADPFPIHGVSEACVSGRADSPGCRWREPTTEQELAELHDANIPSDLDADEIHFTLHDDALDAVDGRLLVPFTESRDLLARVEHGGGAESLQALSADLTRALASELSQLDAVSAQASTVSNALAAAGKTTSKAAELLPYAAIAATGYALSADIASGDWMDAGFDGAAEGLMLVGAGQPELLVFTEPALLLDMAVQWVVDEFHARNAPAPVMEAWRRDQAERDYGTWQSLPTMLAELRLQLTEEQLVAATESVMREEIVPALQHRLAADERVLSALAATYRRGTHLAAVRAAGGEFAGEAYEAVRAQEQAALGSIDRAFALHETARREAYVLVLGEQVQAAADHFGSEWAANTAAFERIRAEFDQVIATPTLDAAEELMFQYSRYQNPPISYPAEGSAGDFRERLKAGNFARYEAEYARIFPTSLRVSMPNDADDYRRLLEGGGRVDEIVHPRVWGQAPPGGVTAELTIRDPRETVAAELLTVIAPPGATVQSIRTSEDGPTTQVAPDRSTATVRSTDRLLSFGGKDGLSVFVTMKAPIDSAPGSTLVGSVIMTGSGGRAVSRAALDLIVHDTIPAGHGFAVPGGVTENVVIYDPRAAVGGEMQLTAPMGTTFEEVTNNIGATTEVSADRRTATVARTGFGGASATVWAKFRVPSSAKQDVVFEGGRVVVVESSTVVASGGLTVSTHPVTVSQTVVPEIVAEATGKATVRITNHAVHSTSGGSVTMTAPANTVFIDPVSPWIADDSAAGSLTGVLSSDGRSMRVSSDELRIGAGGWIELTVALRAGAGGIGTVDSGVFAIDPGSPLLPSGTSTSLAYVAVISRIPAAYGSAGPGEEAFLTIYDPLTTTNGTMTLVAPAGMRIQGVADSIGSSATISGNRATIPRGRFGGVGATVWLYVSLDPDARPTRTYTGTVVVADNGADVATGTFSVTATIDGCLTQETLWRPIGLLVWFNVARVKNTCRADIDVKVPFAAGPESGWAVIGYEASHDFWSTPWASPGKAITGTVSPDP